MYITVIAFLIFSILLNSQQFFKVAIQWNSMWKQTVTMKVCIIIVDFIACSGIMEKYPNSNRNRLGIYYVYGIYREGRKNQMDSFTPSRLATSRQKRLDKDRHPFPLTIFIDITYYKKCLFNLMTRDRTRLSKVSSLVDFHFLSRTGHYRF